MMEVMPIMNVFIIVLNLPSVVVLCVSTFGCSVGQQSGYYIRSHIIVHLNTLWSGCIICFKTVKHL